MQGIKIENRTHAPVDFDTDVAATITSHDAGYIEKGLEQIVGLQTDAPLSARIDPLVALKWSKAHVKPTIVN